MPEDIIWIITDDNPIDTIYKDSSRGQVKINPFDDTEIVENSRNRRVPVKAEKLERGITEFLQVLGRVFSNATQQAGELTGLDLDEIELSVEINGEGQLSLLGTGSKVGGKGAVTLHFKKVEPK